MTPARMSGKARFVHRLQALPLRIGRRLERLWIFLATLGRAFSTLLLLPFEIIGAARQLTKTRVEEVLYEPASSSDSLVSKSRR